MKRRTKFLIMFGAPALVLIAGFIAYRILNAEQIISHKTYAAAIQSLYVSRYLNEAPERDVVHLLPRKGTLDKELLPLYETVEDVHFVDPFQLGRRSMTWTFKNKSVPWAQNFKLRGVYLNYVTNSDDIIVLVYAGPDGYISNHNIDVSVFKSGANYKLLDKSLDYEKMIIPHYSFDYPVVYDPTNGLRSGGDILLPIFKNEAYGWHSVFATVK